MSYRTIKRAFGETNLERKCRVLFGVCLGLLIFGAFLWVDRIGEKLVKRNTDQIGRDWAKMALFHLHWMRWETSDETETFLLRGRELQAGLRDDEVLVGGLVARRDGPAKGRPGGGDHFASISASSAFASYTFSRAVRM